MDEEILRSVLSKSVTTAIAIDITEIIGGITPIIVGSVVLTGIFGVVVNEWIFKLLKIDSYFDLENKIFFQLDNEIGRNNKSFGVRRVEIAEDTEGHDLVYNPDHPDANEEGYVIMSNVNMVDEMISLIESQRTYEANVTAFNTSKNMMKKALEISKG